MPIKKTTQMPFIQSLDRGLTILHAVALSKQPVSLGELAELLGVDRSSAFRLAHTLRRRGFLSCPANRKDYILGSSMWYLTHHYDWNNMLVRVASQQLKQLAAQLNETAHLAIREGKNALFIDSAAVNQVLTVSGQAGELVPLYCTAHGKALLADADEAELRSIFGTGPFPVTPKAPLRASLRWPRTAPWSRSAAMLPMMPSTARSFAAWRRQSGLKMTGSSDRLGSRHRCRVF